MKAMWPDEIGFENKETVVGKGDTKLIWGYENAQDAPKHNS
jgi:hypothetical protein